MKTKQSIYFVLILLGGLCMGFGDRWVQKEYALSLGLILLMFGIYSMSRSWKDQGSKKDEEQ